MESCLTCYGSGETVTDGAPQTCPDCFGEGKALSRGAKLEWRLRFIEGAVDRRLDHEMAADVLWLARELRAAREALLRVATRCADAEETDAVAHDVMHMAHEALGLYPPVA